MTTTRRATTTTATLSQSLFEPSGGSSSTATKRRTGRPLHYHPDELPPRQHRYRLSGSDHKDNDSDDEGYDAMQRLSEPTTGFSIFRNDNDNHNMNRRRRRRPRHQCRPLALWSLTCLGSLIVATMLLRLEQSPSSLLLFPQRNDRTLKQKQKRLRKRTPSVKAKPRRRKKQQPSLLMQAVSTAQQIAMLPANMLFPPRRHHHHKKKQQEPNNSPINGTSTAFLAKPPPSRDQLYKEHMLLLLHQQEQERDRQAQKERFLHQSPDLGGNSSFLGNGTLLGHPGEIAMEKLGETANNAPLEVAEELDEEEEEEDEQDVQPTPAPTVPSLFQNHQYPLVHVIHTPLLLQTLPYDSSNKVKRPNDSTNTTTTTQDENSKVGADDLYEDEPPSPLAWAQLELWRGVTLPSVKHQTNPDFLYIIWTDASLLHPKILERLRQILEQEQIMENAIVLDIQYSSGKATEGQGLQQQMTLQAAAGSRPSQNLILGGMAPWSHVMEYAAQAQSKALLETTLQPTDAIVGEFVALVQKDAHASLLVAPPAGGNLVGGGTKANAGGGYFQIWCSNLYLEWYMENPWNPKSGKRGILLGQVALQSNDGAAHRHRKFLHLKKHGEHAGSTPLSHKQQQCDFSSGLTIGTTPGIQEPVLYDVYRGLEGKLAVQLQQARQKEERQRHSSWTAFPFFFFGLFGQSTGDSTTKHLLPSCMDDRPRNCLRYVDVGLNEYGVMRTRTWAAVDQLDRVDVILPAASVVEAKHVIPIDEGWRPIQNHLFAILKGRFGVNPKVLSSALKPFLVQLEVPIIKEQYKIQTEMCESKGILSSLTNRFFRRLTGPGNSNSEDDLEHAGALETSVTDNVLASSFVPKECHIPSLHAVEVRYGEIQQELDHEREQEEERLKSAMAEKAAADEAQRARDRAQALAAKSFTKYAKEHDPTGGDNGNSSETMDDMIEVRLHPYQRLPETKPNRTVAVSRKWKNEQQENVVHVVHTRFMQHQAQLLNLGKARIDLFQTFTIPSMRRQTTQDYLWIVWTDPKLDKHLLYGLMEELKDFPNAVIVGNHEIVTQDFRQSMNGLLLENDDKKLVDPKSVLWGSRLLLIDYYKKSKSRILLETRLDADDALAHDFLETVQRKASTSISQTDKTDYRIWCTNHFMDWRYYEPEDLPDESRGFLEEQLGTIGGPKIEKGYLSPEKDLKGCVTVGLTMAFQTKANLQELPTKEHHKIRQALPSCEVKNFQCITGLDAPENRFYGLRSRTPTSTSMINVIDEDFEAEENTLTQFDLWNSVQRDFSIAPTTVWDLRNRFQANLPDILLDAIAGLCKAGHSCRHSSKETLMDLLKQSVADATASDRRSQKKKRKNDQDSSAKRTPEQEEINKQFAALAAEMKNNNGGKEDNRDMDLSDKLDKLSSIMNADPISSTDQHNITERSLVASTIDDPQDYVEKNTTEDQQPEKPSINRTKKSSELSSPRVYIPRAAPDSGQKEQDEQKKIQDESSVQTLLLEGGDAIED